jgi:hypothetical protein
MREPSAAKVGSSTQPTYDDSEWPIFRVKMPPVALSMEDFHAHIDACGEPYKRGQRFCMLIDMGKHPPLGAVRRKAVADGMMEHNRRFPGLILGCALVVHSDPSRGGVTAITWVAQPAYPFTAFGDAADAKAWLVRLLEQNRTAERGGPGSPSDP